MSISISAIGSSIPKAIGCCLVVASCSWLMPAKAQSLNPQPPLVAPSALATGVTTTALIGRTVTPVVVSPSNQAGISAVSVVVISSIIQPIAQEVTPPNSPIVAPSTRQLVVPTTPQTIAQGGAPVATESLQQRANAAYMGGDAALAVNLYAQLLQQQPTSYLFQVRLAVAMLNAGPEYVSRSYEAFQKARDLNPDLDEPLIFLGRLEESFEQPEKALATYQKAYVLNPNNQDAFIGIQRLQAQVPLPIFPEGLEVAAQRDLADYLTAIETNSRVLQGLRSQRSIIQGFAWRSALPYVNLGYSWSHSTNTSAELGNSDPCIGGRRQSSGQACGNGSGSSNGFSIGVNWNLTELFVNSNQLRIRAYEDEINKNLADLKTETQRLFSTRRSLLEEFRELSWRAALNPTDPAIRYSRRDRYLQILYVSQQIYNITGLY